MGLSLRPGLGAAGLILLAGASSYTLLPAPIESRLEANLRENYGPETEPTVDVSSEFPPELLLGRMVRIGIRMDTFARAGVRLQDLRVQLEGADASVLGLLGGAPDLDARAGSLVARVPEDEINEYLRANDLGLEGGRIEVSRSGSPTAARTSSALPQASAWISR